jgi:biotin/methionine sulfoxide reductase
MLLNPGATFDFNGRRLTYPDIRLVYWCGAIPSTKSRISNRSLRAWQKPETIIIHEPVDPSSAACRHCAPVRQR